jgi:hypothetical protein
MNPHKHILDSLTHHAMSYGKPQAPTKGSQPMATSGQPQNIAGPLAQLQGLPAGNAQAFMLTPDAKRMLAGIPGSLQRVAHLPSQFQPPKQQQLFNSFAQPQQGGHGDGLSQQANAQQAPNPYLVLLQQRLGVAQQKTQGPNPSPQVGQNPSVIGGGFNPQNTVVPQQNQIRNNLAIDPTKQREGDLII